MHLQNTGLDIGTFTAAIWQQWFGAGLFLINLFVIFIIIFLLSITAGAGPAMNSLYYRKCKTLGVIFLRAFMSITLQFAVGDKQEIIKATKDADFDFLEKLESENRLADFSLHIIPDDLNLLINSAAEFRNLTPFGLREHLDTTLFYFDSEDSGAYLVDPIIKKLFSELNPADASKITSDWFTKMNAEHNEDFDVTEDSVLAVQELIRISKEAKNSNLDLVHAWFL